MARLGRAGSSAPGCIRRQESAGRAGRDQDRLFWMTTVSELPQAPGREPGPDPAVGLAALLGGSACFYFFEAQARGLTWLDAV